MHSAYAGGAGSIAWAEEAVRLEVHLSRAAAVDAAGLSE